MTDDPKDGADKKPEEPVLSEELFSGFDMVPDWVRREPSATEHHERPQRRSGGGGNRGPSRNRRDSRDNRGRRDGPGGGQQRPAYDHHPQARSMPRPTRVERAHVDVSIIPDSKRLSAVIRRIRLAKRAYLLLDVANLFIANTGSCRIKVSAPRDVPDTTFYFCKVCRTVSCDRDVLESHIIETHLGDYFVKEETETEPPSGKFVCVARCGMSGELLGPPNHHSYAARLQHIHVTRFSHVPFEEYQKRVEVVRDENLIEEWRAQSCKLTVYRKKGEGDELGDPMPWPEAVEVFKEGPGKTMIARGKRATLPLEVGLKVPDRSLMIAIQDAWGRETRYPRTIIFALRAAFRHMGLHVFRNENGADVVSAITPAPLDAKHAVETIQKMIAYVDTNAGCTLKSILETFDSEAVPGAESQLEWLVEKGHLIEYANGVLALPPGARRTESK